MKSNKNMKISALLTLFVAACYTPETRAAYEDVGVGARVTGMGNAFTAIADDVYAVYYNPAGLGTLDRPQLATTYSRLFTGLSDNSNLQNSFIAFEKPIQHGRHGAYGMAWNYFTLSGLYRESSLLGSYGRRIFPDQAPHGLYVGATLKSLSRGVGSTDAAENSFSDTGAVRLGVPDPVLQKGSKSNMDFDFGLLYRPRPRFTTGLMVQHLLEPNIAFSDNDTDKLGRNVKLGAAYQTPWTSLSGELGFLKAPDGSTDRVATLAAEKWLPTLLHGTFGVRGSMGVGDREYRQFTAGISYRIYRMQLDYSFAIPLGTINSTFGTHRMGLSFRFGRPLMAEPKFAEAILENIRELADIGTPEFRAQAEQLALYKRTAQQEFLRQARVDTGEGRFAEAKQKLHQALGLNPKDRSIQGSLESVSMAADIFPALENFRTDPGQAALYEGIMDVIAGREKSAVRKLAYAQSLQPADERVEQLLQAVEQKAGLARELPVPADRPAPTLGKEKIVGARMALMDVALREGAYDKVIKLAGEVLEVDPGNALALKRTATSYYAKKDNPQALKYLRLAYRNTRQSEERKTLRRYIDALVKLMEGEAKKKAPTPRVQPAAKRVAPVEIQRLYEAGVDLYAQGRLSEAANMFQRILRVDPKNRSAQRALSRVQAEILRGE
ncbi:MAG: type IX secretion system membrane protein PorP/SprF [Elusimicrobiota bacterium]